MATVLREGQLKVLPAAELVPGDLVEIAGGPPILLQLVKHHPQPDPAWRAQCVLTDRQQQSTCHSWGTAGLPPQRACRPESHEWCLSGQCTVKVSGTPWVLTTRRCAVGAKIPADLRLVELLSSTLRVDQARLVTRLPYGQRPSHGALHGPTAGPSLAASWLQGARCSVAVHKMCFSCRTAVCPVLGRAALS